MEPIPKEWVDKLFNCMEQFYGERWSRYFDKPHVEAFYKTIWQNGLAGLTYEEIKQALVLCKQSAQTSYIQPPHLMEFFHIAKGNKRPYIKPGNKTTSIDIYQRLMK